MSIEPALTPKEWAIRYSLPGDAPGFAGGMWGADRGRLYVSVQMYDDDVDYELDAHKAAALALVGHPYGFTWGDVDRLRAVAVWIERVQEAREFRDLAARIEALLPPRDIEPVYRALLDVGFLEDGARVRASILQRQALGLEKDASPSFEPQQSVSGESDES